MDPQQRLLLHAAAEALEDAGYSPNTTPTFRKDKFGVYAGVATGDYEDNLRDDIDVYYSPGKSSSSVTMLPVSDIKIHRHPPGISQRPHIVCSRPQGAIGCV